MPGHCRVARHVWSGIWRGSAGRRSLWRSWATLRAIAQHKQMVYGWVTACQDDRSDGVIRNFADKEAERLFATGQARRLPQGVWIRALVRLHQLHFAKRVEDLRSPPSNRLEALTGNRAGQWRDRINRRWRLCFKFGGGNAFDVEIAED